ncbi:MAG: chorismate mutase [Deltaproteobacteria bacterium]|jgi:chorismate mutase|nr:chorismate mutase [Deltaproteobacteria bacterium]
MEKLTEDEFATELARLRLDIDLLDGQLLALLNERAKVSLAVGRLKKRQGQAVADPERERRLLEALLAKNSGPLSVRQVESIYQVLFAVSKELQV